MSERASLEAKRAGLQAALGEVRAATARLQSERDARAAEVAALESAAASLAERAEEAVAQLGELEREEAAARTHLRALLKDDVHFSDAVRRRLDRTK